MLLDDERVRDWVRDQDDVESRFPELGRPELAEVVVSIFTKTALNFNASV